jgi:hypothetical protein
MLENTLCKQVSSIQKYEVFKKCREFEKEKNIFDSREPPDDACKEMSGRQGYKIKVALKSVSVEWHPEGKFIIMKKIIIEKREHLQEAKSIMKRQGYAKEKRQVEYDEAANK